MMRVTLHPANLLCACHGPLQDVFNETRSILEPAGAIAVAGAKAYLKHYGLSGQTVVAVTSGANMNFDRLRLVAGGCRSVGRASGELRDTASHTPAMLCLQPSPVVAVVITC